MNPSLTIAIIVATDDKGAIGLNGDMPWRLPADLKRFRAITMGHPVIMGRRTFESLPGGALPGRMNIVVSKSAEFLPAGATVARSPEEALELCKDLSVAFIIGGGTLYRHFILQADLLYITVIHHTYEDADTWFPAIPEGVFELTEKEDVPSDGKFPHPYSFLRYSRKK